MAGQGKEGERVVEDPEPTVDQFYLRPIEVSLCSRLPNPCQVLGGPNTRQYNLVTEEETEVAYVYKMDKPQLMADEVRVEIRRGRTLRLIGRGDELGKVKLRRNSEMRVRKATASLSADGVLTVVIPKRDRPRKWHEYADSVSIWFKTVRVGVSS